VGSVPPTPTPGAVRGSRADPLAGGQPGSGSSPSAPADPSPTSPNRCPQGCLVAILFYFKRDRLKPRSGTGRGRGAGGRSSPGRAAGLTQFRGGNPEGFSKAWFSYFVVVVVVQLAPVIYSMHA